jgi:hypothetical protein
MRIVPVLLRSEDPILVTHRGKVAGVFFPVAEGNVTCRLQARIVLHAHC